MPPEFKSGSSPFLRVCALIVPIIYPNIPGNRIWIGIQEDPPLELELAIDPIISNKSVQMDVVNRLIQNRMKQIISDALLLPKMQDFPFWTSAGMGGFFQEGSIPKEKESESYKADLDKPAQTEKAQEKVIPQPELALKESGHVPVSAETVSGESIAVKSREVLATSNSTSVLESPDATRGESPARLSVKLNGPLAPLGSSEYLDDAVGYLSATAPVKGVYSKAVEYGIDTRVQNIAGWLGVDNWIKVEEKVSLEEEQKVVQEGSDDNTACAQSPADSLALEEPGYAASSPDLDVICLSTDLASSSDEAEPVPVNTIPREFLDEDGGTIASSPTAHPNTPANGPQTDQSQSPLDHEEEKFYLASQVLHFEETLYRSPSAENLPDWAKVFAQDLIQHCAEKAVEQSLPSSSATKEQRLKSRMVQPVYADLTDDQSALKSHEGGRKDESAVFSIMDEEEDKVVTSPSLELDNLSDGNKASHDSGVFFGKGLAKEETKAELLDSQMMKALDMDTLIEAQAGPNRLEEQVSRVPDDAIKKEEQVELLSFLQQLTEQDAAASELKPPAEKEFLKSRDTSLEAKQGPSGAESEGGGIFRMIPSSIRGLVQSVTDLGKPPVSSLRVVNNEK